jgi:hypothetical protein
VENAVPQRIQLEVLHRVTGYQVLSKLPLQELVEDDPVEEPAEPEPESIPAGVRKYRCAGSMTALFLVQKDFSLRADGLLHGFAEFVQ